MPKNTIKYNEIDSKNEKNDDDGNTLAQKLFTNMQNGDH